MGKFWRRQEWIMGDAVADRALSKTFGVRKKTFSGANEISKALDNVFVDIAAPYCGSGSSCLSSCGNGRFRVCPVSTDASEQIRSA